MPKVLNKVVARRKTNAEAEPSSTSSNTLPQSAEPHISNERCELFELSLPEGKKTIDIIAVHGLLGDAFKTWEHENGSLWIRDFLPKDIPFARVFTFGYESTVAFSKSVATIEDKSLQLLTKVGSKRHAVADESPKRPMIFVCHSLGGIIIKKALNMAHDRCSDPDFIRLHFWYIDLA